MSDSTPDPNIPVPDDDQPNDPAEGPRDDNRPPAPKDKIPSTHIPDNRAFDL